MILGINFNDPDKYNSLVSCFFTGRGGFFVKNLPD